jgi:putative Holliday junction resolvase
MARLLGIDPGTVRCGVAITDSAETMAFPRPALANDDAFIGAIGALIEEESVTTIVVGHPVGLSGSETASTTAANLLFDQLVKSFPDLAVTQFDERLTTVEAQRSLSQAGMKTKQHRDHVDSAAAVIMLQHYVEGRRVR